MGPPRSSSVTTYPTGRNSMVLQMEGTQMSVMENIEVPSMAPVKPEMVRIPQESLKAEKKRKELREQEAARRIAEFAGEEEEQHRKFFMHVQRWHRAAHT